MFDGSGGDPGGPRPGGRVLAGGAPLPGEDGTRALLFTEPWLLGPSVPECPGPRLMPLPGTPEQGRHQGRLDRDRLRPLSQTPGHSHLPQLYLASSYLRAVLSPQTLSPPAVPFEGGARQLFLSVTVASSVCRALSKTGKLLGTLRRHVGARAGLPGTRAACGGSRAPGLCSSAAPPLGDSN